MDEVNSEDIASEWKTPNSSEFGSLDNSCVKQVEFEETQQIINQIDNLEIGAQKVTIVNGDGNDSGVDTGATKPIQLQRALSNNSAGYASSSGGLDVQFASCNSSLLSVCSDSHDGKTTILSCKMSADCTSENGSESSSLSGDKQRLRQASPKKRVGLNETNQLKTSRNSECSAAKNRARAASANRATNHRSYGAPLLATSERARSRDKQITSNSQSPIKRVKPGSLPTNTKDVQQKSSTLKRTASVSRRQTPSGTPSKEDDGRWPSNQFRSASKVQNRNTNDPLIIKTKVGSIVLENRTTLSRQTKVKSEEDLSEWRPNRSSSTTRDRMTSSTIIRRESLRARESPIKGISAFPPRYQKPSKTIIYHEAAIQTAITGQDIHDAFGGNPPEVRIDAVLKIHRESQVDIRDKEIEQLEEKLKKMDAENKKLRQNLIERSQLLTSMESQLTRERDEKVAMKKELQSNTERVLGMLELVHASPATEPCDTSCDSLLMLESQIQLSGHVLEEKQIEINTLRHFCNQLQAEMNRSMQVQQNLLEEKKCFEKETTELQDFLQVEKEALFEELKQKDLEVERLQEECRHLVRISEQRRQEYLGLQSKYRALESKNKISIVHQSHTVSGATLALSDLGSRLNDLVEQLVASYNISEKEIEDIVYHNEAYANSEESTPDSDNNPTYNGTTSPQRNNSFITAVINAIKNAASSAKDKVNHKVEKLHSIETTDGLEMLDSETEPCLMMENVLEDVSMPDSHTQNLISSCVLPSSHSLDDNRGDSLNSLCEAIANRQKIEEQTTLMMMNQSIHSEANTSGKESMINSSIYEQEYPVQILVDNVINVDNLVTKLLKILRIIQIENDNCIQQLISEKNMLQLNKVELELKTKELVNNCNELDQNHTELKKGRREIDKLNDDICNLSTLCSSTPNQSFSKSEDEPADKLKTNGDLLHEILPSGNNVYTMEHNSEVNLNLESQNDTISRAIETLNGIQSIVRQCPALIDLQKNLEQMLPSDCNANIEFQYKDVNVEEYDWQNSTFEVSLEENSEPNIDISFVIPEEDLMDAVIDDRFVIGNLIASGHVGLIYTGTEINTGSKVVIKLSQPEMSKSLENEYHNYLLLGAADPDIMNLGIPQIIYFDVFGGYKVMVMHTMLGPTLRELKEFTGRNKLSFKTCMKVAIQAMDIFNYIHSKGLIVYDISSSNIAIGNAKETLNKIFIFDFASSFKSSPEDMLRNELNDLILFALVLMDLNGIQFTPMNDLSRNSHIEAALEYLLDEWDENYLEDLYSQSENPEVFFEFCISNIFVRFLQSLEYRLNKISTDRELNSRKMIIALLQQCLIFLMLYNFYCGRNADNFEEENCMQYEESSSSNKNLALVHELKSIKPVEYLLGLIINDQFQIQEHLGHGFIGFVCSIDIKTGNEVAIKFATKDMEYALEKEFINYLYLGADDPDIQRIGIPHIYYFGDFLDYKVLVMTKVGKTLFDITKSTDYQKLNLNSICKIAMQAINIFEYIHEKGLTFHDVTPSNIAVSHLNENHIFFFGFAFSEFYVNALGEAKMREKSEEINGTPEYMTIDTLKGLTHVRKDDFISFGLVLLELNGVVLPWIEKTNNEEDIYKTIDIVLNEWNKISIEEICKNSENPQLFITYFEYLQSLRSQEKPDYNKLLHLFSNELTCEELADENLNIFHSEEQCSNTFNNCDSTEANIEGALIDNRYLIGELLGSGHTGFVRSGVDIKTETEVAIKFAKKGRIKYLEREYDNYIYLGADDCSILTYGIPRIFYFGNFHQYKVLIMSKAGSTLYDLQKTTKKRKFNLKTIYKIAIQAIKLFKYIHSKGLVCVDVKPDNIAVGSADKNQIFFFDFAFSKLYVDAQGEVKKREKEDELYGTPVYMGRGPLHRLTHVRKDDLISLGLVLLKLNGVLLPWYYEVDDQYDIENQMDIVLKYWDKYGIEAIVADSDDPKIFLQYFLELDSINGHEEPDYNKFFQLFAKELTADELEDPDLGIF
ncbi:uncharacterized protein LOC116340515 [Contarinia nasturtii]|uniref:uncharacterized protein LOC116340515 n=1 Tax=Contarinia nasturtii TaxID=265458 RepID=UPI0012D3BB03|nr:uncharacterized protein LOC116340515 [Contarinia nasturtii]